VTGASPHTRPLVVVCVVAVCIVAADCSSGGGPGDAGGAETTVEAAETGDAPDAVDAQADPAIDATDAAVPQDPGEVLTACPADLAASEGKACAGDFTCSGGKVTCCGKDFQTMGCSCTGGTFGCWFADPEECLDSVCPPQSCSDDWSCPAGWQCVLLRMTSPDLVSVCIPCGTCEPHCEGLECGDDGCGGSCATCPDWLACMDHHCVNVDPPFCDGKECGPDGVGGICGQCPVGWTCGPLGQCEPAGGCGGLPPGGACVSGSAVTCEAGKTKHVPCPFGACKLDVDSNAACEAAPCIADCFGRQCGGDGCGGSCGTCSNLSTCDPALGVCLPSPGCGWVTEKGTCVAHVLARCVNGKIQTESCLAKGQVCRVPSCPGGAACISPGPGFPCNGLPAAGHCEGQDHLFVCDGGSIQVKHCKDWWKGSRCMRAAFDRYACEWMFE